MIRYEYRDAGGRVRYVVVRHGHGPGKSFQILDSAGIQLSDPIPKNRRILYRLPELSAAPPSETIFLAEGEKDAELLASHGFVSTTMPCGTRGGWLPSYTRSLEGRHVVILPDNDGPGRRHGEAVEGCLAGRAASVLKLELGGRSGLDDVSTWFDRQQDPANKLRKLVLQEWYSAIGLEAKHPPNKVKAIELVCDCGLDTLTRLMLVLLIECVYRGVSVYKKVADLAQDCGVHRVTCQRAMGRLKSLGILDGIPRERSQIRWDLLAASIFCLAAGFGMA